MSATTEALKPCPMCGGPVQLRAALWPADGDYDSIIHAEPSECGMVDFTLYTCDGSVAAAWNRRAAEAPAPAAEAVAWAVVSKKGGIHKLAITRDSANRKAATWQEEWPNNGCTVRPLVYGDARPQVAAEAASIDTPEFRKLLNDFGAASTGDWGHDADDEAQCTAKLIAHINAWGASLAAIAAPEDAWVSVDDRLPAKGQSVLAFRPTAPATQDPLFTVTFYSGRIHADWQDVEHGFDCFCHPTHWMPIAPPRAAIAAPANSEKPL